MTQLFADQELSRRLEKAEARGGTEFVEARAMASPATGAEWIEIGGTVAMFDGPESPITQTFCLGMFQETTRDQLQEIEEFFANRNAPVFHEVSPLASPTTLALLAERYRPFELSNVMFRSIDENTVFAGNRNNDISVRRINHDEHQLWASTAARGWSEFKEAADFMSDLAGVTSKRKSGLSYIAELDGAPIAAGALTIHDGVALLAGASTVPERRKLGAQLALLEGRISDALDQGCDLAMMVALPGSASQRNAERQGFRIAYTRIKWKKID